MLPPIINSTAPSALVVQPASSQSWRVGTVLDAMARTATTDGAVRLQIGARVIDARTTLSLQPGQMLRLQVTEMSSRIVLRPVTTDAVPERIRAAQREALPRQRAQAPLIASARAAGAQRSLPPPVSEVLNNITAAVNDARALTTADGLRRAVRESGNFLESRLAAREAPALPRDWKGALLQARERLAAWLSSQRGTTGATGKTAAQSAPNASPAAVGATRTVKSSPAAQANAAASGTPARVATPVPQATATAIAPAAASTAVAQQGTAATKISSPVSTGAPATPASAMPPPPARPGAAMTRADASAPPARHALPAVQPSLADARLPADTMQMVGRLVEQVEGALARVQLNQLVTVTPDPVSKTQVWMLELPVAHRNGDSEVVTLRIERDDRDGADPAQRAWSVDLAFDLEQHGTLRARVALHGGKIFASLLTDNPATRHEVERRLPALESAFAERELDVGCLTCAETGTKVEAPPADTLLDTRA